MKKFILTAIFAISIAIFENAYATTHYWTGTSNHFWGTAGNWNTGTVPTASDDVVIQAGTPYSCWISINDRQCNNLTVNTNASLRVYDEELTVNGNIDIYGTLIMDNNNGKIWAHQDVTWHSGSQAGISAWAAIKVWGNWYFLSGSNVQLYDGFVEFLGAATQYITCKSSTSYFNTLVLNYSYDRIFSANSTYPLKINKDLYVGTSSTLKSNSSNSIILNGQLNVQGEINLTNGNFIYNGPSSSVTAYPQYFNNLIVNSTGTLSFTGLIYIYNDLILNGGVFAPGNVQIFGNWTNNVGPAAFYEGSTSVFFMGNSFQQCSSEIFYEISVDKSGSWLSPQQGATINTLNHTYINQGKLKMTDNSTLQVDGGLYFYNGAHIDATGASNVNIYLYGGFLNDANTTQSGFIPGTSNIHFHIDQYYFMVYSDAPTFDFYKLTKTGTGALRFVCNTKVLNNVTIMGGSWNQDGYTSNNHYFYGDIILEPGAYFLEKGNVIFQGDYQHNVDLADGYAVFGETTVAGSKNSNNKGLSVIVTADSQDSYVSVFRDLTIGNGSLQLEDNTLKAYENISINDGGELILSEGTAMKIKENKQLNVFAGGYFKSYGTAQKPVSVSRMDNSTGFYGFYVNLNGNIAASHTIFEYMNTDGIRMKYGSLIDTGYPFDYCVFRNGEANGTFLFINTTQCLTIANAVFEDNTYGSTYNVGRDLNVGSVTFKWAKGDFAGETHEYDYYGNVYWDYTPLQISAKVFLEGPFNGSGMNVDINSKIPLTQPYSGSPWNYNGTESVSAITNPNIVDWVLLELRATKYWASTTTNESVIARRACFLLNDGTLIDTDNSTTIPFNAALGADESVFLVVKHRNHLGVLSAWALTQSGGVYNYDFSTGPGQVVGSNQGNKFLGNGIWGMYAGDSNADGTINYNDINAVWKNMAGSSEYHQSDLNMDAQTDNKDKNDVLIPNLWETSQIPE